MRSEINEVLKGAYSFSPYVRKIIEITADEKGLPTNNLTGKVDFDFLKWTLVLGDFAGYGVDSQSKFKDVKLAFFPFVFYALAAELKSIKRNPMFSEYYTPFIMAWSAILSGFYM